MELRNTIICGDAETELKKLPDNCVDLVFGSPPYEDARTYGIDFNLKDQVWVDWMVSVVKESLRVCKGLVAFVVEGKTKRFRWSATPALLMADLHRAGIHLRKPPLYKRNGIPGSGGPDWLANKYEFIICATSGGKLSWSNNLAMGHPPKWQPGGEMSHRTKSGVRTNRKASRNRRPDGTREVRSYSAPNISNPGNIIDCGTCGGGHIGDKLAHETEAPFPEKLAEFFVASFCPPDGVVLDCFSGSGTTVSVAKRLGRKWIAIDIRQNQCELTRKRLELSAVETGVSVQEQKQGQMGLF